MSGSPPTITTRGMRPPVFCVHRNGVPVGYDVGPAKSSGSVAVEDRLKLKFTAGAAPGPPFQLTTFACTPSGTKTFGSTSVRQVRNPGFPATLTVMSMETGKSPGAFDDTVKR